MEINNTENTIDLRDVITAFEEFEAEFEDGFDEDAANSFELSQHENFKMLEELLSDLAGNGGDEQWRGDWYPVTLIRDSHFEDYARELAEDIGVVDREAAWPNNCIDWEEAADQLRNDYSVVEFGEATYLYR